MVATEKTIRSLTLALAAVSTRVASNHTSSNEQPCAQLSQQYAQAQAANATFQPSGKLAYNCLQSMPFRSDLAVAFLDEYEKYLNFQTTIEILKDPPPGYLSPPTDLLGGLDLIRQKAAANQYPSQYEFDTELTQLINSANDGHLSISLCSTSVFGFLIDLPLVSVSTDGLALPELYTYNDAVSLAQGDQQVSPLISINGIDAVEFLEKVSSSQSFQDPDARYNSLFPNRANPTIGSAWMFNPLWPGAAYYTFKYANETIGHVETLAILTGGDFNFTDGTALYEAVCLPSSSASSASSNSTAPIAAPIETILPGYPAPVIRDPYYLISGYYLNDTDLQDVAVLAIPTFNTEGTFTGGTQLPDDEEEAFHQVAVDFVNNATAAGKKKILIDLSGNPGGVFLSGYDLFKIFFPDVFPYSATRFRAHPGAYLIGKSYSQVGPSDPNDFLLNPFAVQAAVTPDQKGDFATWDDLFGPHLILGVNSSSLAANLNFSSVSDAQSPISGFGNVTLDPTTRPFAPEDIVIITDGLCTSTCTIFTELMKWQGVRSIVFGGRPQYGPMQALGGSKGANSAPYTALSSYATEGYALAVNASRTSDPVLTPEELDQYNSTVGIPVSEFPLPLLGGEVNLKNNYRPGNDIVPLQFIYEAAECRLFFTIENYQQQETIWAAAARAMFGNGSCVLGSTNATGSLYGPSSVSNSTSGSGSGSGSPSNLQKAAALLIELGQSMSS
ncbi:hypothetical protein VTN77DRAFT_3511 [Rasamsonia byssochlamydoides]|uniref:uncharacterized protein n=1 Tax=Rasamsonia byssochlamydoides TaxID=89139 RepID=UPI0037428862